MISALVFDWGGVIQRTEDAAPRRALAVLLGISPEGLDRAVFGSRAWEQASVGAITAEDAWDAIVASVGWPADDIVGFIECFFGGDRLDEHLVALIRHLRGEGMPVGLLSNALPTHKDDTRRAAAWGIPGLFDAQVYSYEVGALKPQAVMYERVLDALGVPAGETLFVDDAAQNVAGARAAGMEAVLFAGRQRLACDLGQMDVGVPAWF